jgi:hypothetical protein
MLSQGRLDIKKIMFDNFKRCAKCQWHHFIDHTKQGESYTMLLNFGEECRKNLPN